MIRKLLRRTVIMFVAVLPITALFVADSGSTVRASTPANPDALTYTFTGYQTDQNLFISDNGGDVTWGAFAPCQLTGAAVTLSNNVHETFGPTSTGTIAPGGIGVNAISVSGVNCTNSVGAIGLVAAPNNSGYYVVENSASIISYGNVSNPSQMNTGSDGYQPLHVVATTEQSPLNKGDGLLMVNAQGQVHAIGGAGVGGINSSIVGPLNAPIVGIASTPDGLGYWMVASDGGVFTFGDAKFYGSMGAVHLNQPVVGMSVDQATGGYWLVAADGGVFSFNAPFHGSTGNIKLNKPIVGMEAAPDGSGYRFVASDGGVFSFNLPFEGSLGGTPPSSPVAGMAAFGNNGYWLVEHNNAVQAFGSAQLLAQKPSL